MKHEEDLRADRFESEIRMPEMDVIKDRTSKGIRTRIYQCFECKRIYEERSLFCPYCSQHGITKKTMGELVPIKRNL